MYHNRYQTITILESDIFWTHVEIAHYHLSLNKYNNGTLLLFNAI